MSRSRGKRYDDTPKLNKKKVFATFIAIIVFIMIIISLKTYLLIVMVIQKMFLH